MDENKRQVLKSIGYSIPGTCGFCVYGDFEGKTDWGSCLHTDHKYQHEKHSGPRRHLSIYVGGTCSQFRRFEERLSPLNAFREFFSS